MSDYFFHYFTFHWLPLSLPELYISHSHIVSSHPVSFPPLRQDIAILSFPAPLSSLCLEKCFVFLFMIYKEINCQVSFKCLIRLGLVYQTSPSLDHSPTGNPPGIRLELPFLS